MELAFEVEKMMNEAEVLNGLTLAIYDAIYNSCYDYKEFEWALHAVSDMAQNHMKNMKRLTDEAFALLQKESA